MELDEFMAWATQEGRPVYPIDATGGQSWEPLGIEALYVATPRGRYVLLVAINAWEPDDPIVTVVSADEYEEKVKPELAAAL